MPQITIISLVYNLSIMFLYDSPTIDTFMHKDHDKNVSCDGYIVDFTYDVIGNYNERGRHGFIYPNNINYPLSLLKVLKWYLFCLSMISAFNFNDLFSYKTLLHRKWVRLKCV